MPRRLTPLWSCWRPARLCVFVHFNDVASHVMTALGADHMGGYRGAALGAVTGLFWCRAMM
jgi:hypothetical protein